jgi:hypothetical protein
MDRYLVQSLETWAIAVSTVPQGVTPAEQLFKVPCTRVPLGSDEVFSRGLPAAGPLSAIGVSAVRRRLNDEF